MKLTRETAIANQINLENTKKRQRAVLQRAINNYIVCTYARTHTVLLKLLKLSFNEEGQYLVYQRDAYSYKPPTTTRGERVGGEESLAKEKTEMSTVGR